MMSSPVTITLLGKPQGKGRPRFVKASGRTYTPERTRKYEDALREAAEKEVGTKPPIIGPVNVTVLAQFEPPKSWPLRRQQAALRREVMPTGKPDGDNLLKVLDALNGVVWKDDAQVVTATIRKRYGPQALLLVQITETDTP